MKKEGFLILSVVNTIVGDDPMRMECDECGAVRYIWRAFLPAQPCACTETKCEGYGEVFDTAEKQRGANNPRQHTKEEAKNHPGAPG